MFLLADMFSASIKVDIKFVKVLKSDDNNYDAKACSLIKNKFLNEKT